LLGSEAHEHDSRNRHPCPEDKIAKIFVFRQEQPLLLVSQLQYRGVDSARSAIGHI